MNTKKLRKLYMTLVLFLMTSNSLLSAYDGPFGVTYRAPFINQEAAGKIILEKITITSHVDVDKEWSFEKNGKGRDFPESFLATIADSEMNYTFKNKSGKSMAVDVLFPYDASATPTTGFIEPASFMIFLNGKKLPVEAGPETLADTSVVAGRSIKVSLKIPARTAVTVQAKSIHPLGLHNWFTYNCFDSTFKIPKYASLCPEGCDLELQFEPSTEILDRHGMVLQYKEKSMEEWKSEKKGKGFNFSAKKLVGFTIDQDWGTKF